MKSFSFYDREKNLPKIENEIFDILIIGGGITGAGVARDAAMRGMKVCLVEQNDFASGTSSRSSKLIHGGIRYLENREFKLVFEALSERKILFQIAPHLVHPLRFMIPIYKESRVGFGMMGLGMWLYDALSMFDAPELHERLNSSESKQRVRSINQTDLLGSYVYSDAYMDDDRLVLETLRSANEFGALCFNYIKANKKLESKLNSKDSDKIYEVEVTDSLNKKNYKIKAKHIVSSLGPWTDQELPHFANDWKKILRPTKGIHLTFEKSRVPLEQAVVMGAEKRIVFAIPRHEMVIIGTTDTDFNGDPAEVFSNTEDIEYLLDVSKKYFPTLNLKREDIVASYSGVRPLVDDRSSTEGKTSREHYIKTFDHHLTVVAGGKYTTYRLMAEQIVNEVLKHKNFETRAKYLHCPTKTALNPLISEDFLSNVDAIKNEIMIKSARLSESELIWLSERHGQEAIRMSSKYQNDFSYIQMEAMHAIHQTSCISLADFYLRRAPLVLARKDHGLSFLGEIKSVFKNELSLSSAELQNQVDVLNRTIKKEMSW